jgi:hypothetical protein
MFKLQHLEFQIDTKYKDNSTYDFNLGISIKTYAPNMTITGPEPLPQVFYNDVNHYSRFNSNTSCFG